MNIKVLMSLKKYESSDMLVKNQSLLFCGARCLGRTGRGWGRPLKSHALVLRGRGALRASVQGWADFLHKSQIVDIFGFMGLVGSVTQAQSCLCGAKAAVDHMQTNEHG